MQINLLKKVRSGKTVSKILSFLLIFTLSFGMLTGLSSTALAANSDAAGKADRIKSTAKSGVYVALGDSVPAGYGLSDTKDCCVNLFADKMTKNDYTNTMFNYAKSGDTTAMLLSMLQNMQSNNPDRFQAIKNATVITVNIGGNNVLGPLIQAVNEALDQQLKSLGLSSIKDATQMQLFSIALSLLNMNLDDTQMEQIKKGSQSFATDFPKVIEWLKTNAPGANIIVSTIYNPIPNDLNFYKTSEPLLKEMNAIISNGAKKGGYYVADIYSAFAKEQAKGTQIINLNLGLYPSSPLSIDIHPNAAGHELIAKVHNNIFKKRLKKLYKAKK